MQDITPNKTEVKKTYSGKINVVGSRHLDFINREKMMQNDINCYLGDRRNIERPSVIK